MNLPASETPPTEPYVRHVTEHLFRREYGKLTAIVTGLYGAHRLQLAEDVVQESLIRALRTWPYSGVPENPNAWLLRTAKNLALDHLRREQNFLRKQPEIVAGIEEADVVSDDESGLSDDQLRLIFVCCHPALPTEVQTALALKTLCGFSPTEIARAFLISEAAVAKRLTRARQKIRAERIPFVIPAESELPARVATVQKILYLLFNEGHKASQGEEIVRAELCDEAIRLAGLLASHPAGDFPSTHALLALLLLTAARFPSRTDAHGNLLRLEDQDRSRWDARRSALGMIHLAKSAEGDDLSEYHLQAGIAACHSLAKRESETDWPRILQLYDELEARFPSPIVTLNRAVALAKVRGAAAGIAALAGLDERLAGHHLYHAVLGEFHWQNGDPRTAATHLRRALELTETRPERTHLARRLEECLSDCPE